MTNEQQTLWDYFFGNIYHPTRASREAGRLIKRYMSECNLDYKTAAHELQNTVKNLSNEGYSRAYARREPLILKHYEAGKVIDERAKDIAKKTGAKYSDAVRLACKLETEAAAIYLGYPVEPLTYEQVYGTLKG